MKKTCVFLAALLLTVFISCFDRKIPAKAAVATDPAQIIIVKRDGFDLTTKIGENTEEDYRPSSRRFQSMAKIEVVGDRIWACWSTGGTAEPVKDNYLAVAYSDDGGRSWIDPYMIIDHPDSGNTAIKNSVLWLDPNGKLWLMYFKEKVGMFAVTSENAGAENIDDVVWSKETFMYNYGSENKPTVLSNGEWLYMSRDLNNTLAVPVISSQNMGKTWSVKSRAISSVPADRKFAGESALVEKKNGVLLLLSRIEAYGGVEKYVSADKGMSWTSSEVNLPHPLNSPGSRFVFRKLRSGNWLFVTNDDISLRRNLTAYISSDEGETWSKGLKIDARLGAEYPDATEDGKGNIYLIYDCGRFENQQLEIRCSVFTEEDLTAGAFVSENYLDKGIVNKLNPDFSEIVRVSFERQTMVKKGTDEHAVCSSLPERISATDSAGNTYELAGTWLSDTYDPQKTGTYRFVFQTTLADGVEDPYGLLSIDVTVEKSTLGVLSILLIGASAALVVVLAVIIAVKIKTKEKGGKKEK